MTKASQVSPRSEAPWTNTQAYMLAAFCLVLGVTLGYLFRGSASPGANTASAATGSATSTAQGASPHDPAQMKAMLDKATAPLLEVIKNNPNDFESVVGLGNVYYDTQQYPQAVHFYEQALRLQPDNADVITDLGTAYWYTGDADKAIVQFKRSLKIRPNHAGTLFNMGIVEWQGKMDPNAAVTAWEQLLKTNPDYPQKQQIEDFIAKAKQHLKGSAHPS
jgi:cytochrome c-type biogenesis protein CcmH/NrfG